MGLELNFFYTYALVDDDTDGTAGNVENAASGTVVDLVWHTLLDGTVTFDIDNITLETFELNVREGVAPWITIGLPRGKSNSVIENTLKFK